MSTMTLDELRELVRTSVTTDVPTAGRAYGIGTAKAYRLAKANQFPVEVLTIGRRRVVRTALLAADLLPKDEPGLSSMESPGPMTSIPGQENRGRPHAIPDDAA